MMIVDERFPRVTYDISDTFYYIARRTSFIVPRPDHVYVIELAIYSLSFLYYLHF